MAEVDTRPEEKAHLVALSLMEALYNASKVGGEKIEGKFMVTDDGVWTLRVERSGQAELYEISRDGEWVVQSVTYTDGRESDRWVYSGNAALRATAPWVEPNYVPLAEDENGLTLGAIMMIDDGPTGDYRLTPSQKALVKELISQASAEEGDK